MKAAPPTAGAYPNTFAWFVLAHRFSDAARAGWAGAAPAAPAKGGKAAPAKKEEAAPAKKEEPKPAAKAEEDEMDLFGDDDEEDSVSPIK